MKTHNMFVLVIAVSGMACVDSRAELKIARYSCEYEGRPLGIDVPHPRLSWSFAPDERGQRQTAYQVLVASSLDRCEPGKADLWDSGKVDSDASIQVPYQGKPLTTSQRVFWTVRAWDEHGHPSAFVEPASWTMGVLDEKDWQAKWIGDEHPIYHNWASMRLRKEFSIKPGLTRAIAHFCGLGQHELTINGVKAGDTILSPGWTKYDKTCLYDTLDVTDLLKEGPNVVSLLLGNGMYNVTGGRYTKFKGTFGPLKAIAQLRLEYDDGVKIIGTDETWRAQSGPITFSCIYGGEDYDARLSQPGWDGPGFDAAAWETAKIVNGPGGQLRGHSCAAPPLKTFETLEPVKVTPLRDGVAVYDLGQNVSLMPRLVAKGPAGSVVRITPAELIKADGTVDRGSCGGGEAYWQYTLAGTGEETYFPKFFYHGSRYLQVECRPVQEGGERPSVIRLVGLVFHTASDPVGQFTCSKDLFDRTHILVRWAQRSNLVSVVTDCPHRERLGWLEQYHLNGPSLRYEFDLARLFAKGMNDMADSQLENGLVPDIAPEYTVFQGGFRDSPEWGSAYVQVAWQQYLWTGDTDLIRRHFDGMKRYVAYLGTQAKDHIVRSNGLGDWYDIGPKPPGYSQLTPIALTATAFYYDDSAILARMARLIGRASEAVELENRAAEIQKAFNATFFNAKTGQYAEGSETANALPLVMNVVEPPNRAGVLAGLVKEVQGRGNSFTAGDVGYRYLLRALADGGRSDVIFAMNNQSDHPGYGYQLAKGATSLTEAWDAGRASSQNHFMLGQINEWFYHDLAGIAPDAAGPGFVKIVMRPNPVGDVASAKACLETLHGRIGSEWSIADGQFRWKIDVPPNSSATVFVPVEDEKQVLEGDRRASESPGVTLLRTEPGHAVYHIDSGRFLFSAAALKSKPAE